METRMSLKSVGSKIGKVGLIIACYNMHGIR